MAGYNNTGNEVPNRLGVKPPANRATLLFVKKNSIKNVGSWRTLWTKTNPRNRDHRRDDAEHAVIATTGVSLWASDSQSNREHRLAAKARMAKRAFS